MLRVGFTIIGGKTSWMGGINYLKNLLYAISQSENKDIHPILFVGNKIEKDLLNKFQGLAEIKQSSVFDRFSFRWFIDTLLRDLFNVNPLINHLIKKYEIEIFSHSYIYGKDLRCKTVNWIPDFQHIRMPGMFSKTHRFIRNYRLKALAKYSDLVILSSFDALNDFKEFTPTYASKAKVVHFVSQTTTIKSKSIESLEEKYNFRGKYFFLPNQFWVHKNHQVVFEAIKQLKDQQKDLLLICSGQLSDNRNPRYIESLKKFITSNSLQQNIKLLGLIPFNDVLLLMKYSLSIINPSFFEGWSSTVEEAKSMNKNLILSNIPVHIEQAATIASFFDPKNAKELSEILFKQWNMIKSTTSPSNDDCQLQMRTKMFADSYYSSLQSILKC